MHHLEKFVSLLVGEVDGLLLTSEVSRLYFSGFHISEGCALVTAGGSYYLTDSRYFEAAGQGMPQLTVLLTSSEHPASMLLADLISKHSIKSLGVEEDYMTLAEFRRFEEKLPCKLVPAGKRISAPRSSKEDWELALMEKAQSIADAAFAQLLPQICQGISEKELAAELICCLYKNGAEGLSFPPIVVSGPNSSLPHGEPGARLLERGDFITMDFGCVYGGYCSDTTRTVALGSASDEMRRVYDTVARAQEAGIAAARAGVTGRAIDGAARQVIESAGYGEFFGHSFGHSLGLEIHEAPNASPLNDEPMPAGAVISAEPGIYLPGRFGVRIEDVIILTDTGCRNITHCPKELLII